jgi:putative tryptophan/tyrosine transport system substrate-binding protein
MKRREFIAGLSGAAAWPLATRAQQQTLPVVGLLRSTPAAPFEPIVAGLRQGLNDQGFVEGRNVAIEQRWADNQRERLPDLAADLVRRQAAVIVTHGVGVGVARTATAAIPIVFVVGDDPVKMGLVASLNRPEGNLTGVTFFGGGSLIAKRLELLRELVPKATVVAVLLDPDNAGFDVELPSLEVAGRALGLRLAFVKIAGERDLDAAFARIVAAGADAVLFGGGPVLRSQVQQVVALAARHAVPTIYELREYVEAGGLISYSASFAGAYRQAGVYAGKILKGAKPSELPVLRPTTFELAINLKTAKALGLEVPPTLLARADEVIE